MNRLYQKSEIWFAVVWIIVYVVGTSIADGASAALGVEKSITLIFLAALSGAAMNWLKGNGLYEKYGLCKPRATTSQFLYYIPLVILVSCNLWFGIKLNMTWGETVLYMASMIFVGFLEEIIFRGFLFKAMSKDGLTSAIIVSSVTFGIGHIVNLINGSGADLLSNLCQVGYAIAFGFLFVIIFQRSKSLFPCIAAHSVINALSAIANETRRTGLSQIIVSVILAAIAVWYTLALLKRIPEDEK